MGIYQGKGNREKGKGIAWLRIYFSMISKVLPFPGISFSLFPYPFSLPYKFQFAGVE